MDEKLFYKINLCLSKNKFSFKSVSVHFTKTRLLGLSACLISKLGIQVKLPHYSGHFYIRTMGISLRVDSGLRSKKKYFEPHSIQMLPILNRLTNLNEFCTKKMQVSMC